MGETSTRRVAFVMVVAVALAVALAALTLGDAAARAAETEGPAVRGPASAKSVPPRADRLIVGYEKGAEKTRVKEKVGGKVKRAFPEIDAEVVEIEGSLEGKKAELLEDPDVRYVEKDGAGVAAFTPNDTELGAKRQYEIYQQSFDLAWDTARGIDSKTGKGILVAVVDSGCDRRHPDLDGKIPLSYDFANGDPYAWDDTGHGTLVAGIIGAETNNGAGIAGAGYNTRIVCAKASNNDLMYNSDAIAALDWARDRGARVVNLSVQNAPYSRAYEDMARSLWSSGVNIVAAAGNTGGYRSSMYPGGYYGVTAVAAVDAYDRRATFSSYGPYVDLAATGVSVRSTARGGGYADGNGTSFASPTVAAQFALIKARHNTSPDATRNRAQGTALDLGARGRDDYFGFGRIRAAASVR